jgi:Xaa-Pro aminopeptidase
VDYPGERRLKLLACLGNEGMDALLITNPINVSYLTGFSGESSYLILTESRGILVSDSRFTEQLAEECPGLELCIRPLGSTVLQATAEILLKLGLRHVGFESMHLTVAEAEAFRGATATVSWKGAPDRVEKLRRIKDMSEVAQIESAIKIAERAFTALRACLRASDSEKELCDALDHYVRSFGGQATSFPSIVAAGSRSALPHAPPTSRKVGEEGLLLVDWGASGRFYKSDLTRVLIPRNNSAFSKPGGQRFDTSRAEEIYQLVHRAQQRAIAMIRPGVQGHEVDAEARAVITSAGYGDYFGHGLGHGLGLEVHEGPSLRPNADNVLEAGMVVTVEPGIYLPNWGGVRIEDDVLVTTDGCRVLTTLPNDWPFAFCEV